MIARNISLLIMVSCRASMFPLLVTPDLNCLLNHRDSNHGSVASLPNSCRLVLSVSFTVCLSAHAHACTVRVLWMSLLPILSSLTWPPLYSIAVVVVVHALWIPHSPLDLCIWWHFHEYSCSSLAASSCASWYIHLWGDSWRSYVL